MYHNKRKKNLSCTNDVLLCLVYSVFWLLFSVFSDLHYVTVQRVNLRRLFSKTS